MKKDKLLVAITGPSGAGKSTIASLLAKAINQSANIDADHVKHFIVNGFIYDDSPDGIRQWELLGKNIGQLAKNFIDNNYNVIISGYINEPAWNEILKNVRLTHKFLLLPNVEVTIARDKLRIKDYVMGEDAVKTHHKYFYNSIFYNDFIKLDTSAHSSQETLEQIQKVLKYRI